MKQHLFLLRHWIQRELTSRFRGTAVGWLWMLVQPALQVAAMVVVFYGALDLKWEGGQGEGWIRYAINLAIGLLVFNWCAEVLQRAPLSVASHPNLVTKIKFPLKVLPLSVVIVGAIPFFVGFLLVVVAQYFWGGGLNVGIFQSVWIVWVLVTYLMGLALLLGSIGVFVRDLSHAMPSVSGLLMFLSPVFYSGAFLRQKFGGVVDINPLTWAIEALRASIVEGSSVLDGRFVLHVLASCVILFVGFWVFERLARGFVEVI